MDETVDPVIERAEQRVGNTLKEKWRLDALIGVGGMAAVYSATHRNGKRVAVKMLHAELSIDSEVRTRFLREGYAANKVEHPGAVTVDDDETADDGSVFLVMELLDGETLAHRFERKGRSLPIEEILLITDQVLDVLALAHAKHIVHRDIKPDNIFLTRAGVVKVLDFGIARVREVSSQTSATRSGSTMGTPAYMAPEQARARWDEVDARTDLWAVGATMFKLLTGRVVHVAETINEQLLAAMTQPAPPIATLVPMAPIPVLQVVDKALAFNKEDRWGDATTMRQAVRDAYQAIAGVSLATVRLSFDDGDAALAHADTVHSRGLPTSLTAAHDSSVGTKKPRSKGTIKWLALLAAAGAAAYYVSSRDMSASQLPAPVGAEGGVSLAALPSAATALLPTFDPPQMGSAAAEVPREPVGHAPEPGAAAPLNGNTPSRTESIAPEGEAGAGDPPSNLEASPPPAQVAAPVPAARPASPPPPSVESTKPASTKKTTPPTKKKTAPTPHRRKRP